MRRVLIGAVVACGLLASPAAAVPIDVHVRVEGESRTLFDRVVRTDGHDIRAASDTQPRRCDGTNNAAHPTAGATATGATVDAMTTIGQDFDGEWYPGFDDYFLTRWGPDGEDDGKAWWWGLLVNRAFTAVGGCQLRVAPGDEVLWVYDAFGSRPFLWLDAPGVTTVDARTTVTVTSSAGGPGEDAPYGGAQVEGIGADARPAPPGTVDPATTGAGGVAVVTFRHPGWQRLKARDHDPDEHPAAIASNSVDICVNGTDGSGCDGAPPSRIPVVPRDPDPEPTPTPTPTPTATPGGTAPPPPAVARRVRLSAPEIVSRERRFGRVGVRWHVLDPGPGVRDWAISAREAGRGRWTVRARGTHATSSALRLPAGRLWTLRLDVRDALGRAATAAVGTVLVPIDDRAHAVRRRGGWTRRRDRAAWRATVSEGGEGDRASVRLPAGRPVLALRAGSRAARVAVTTGPRRQAFRIAAGRGVERRVTAARRARGGWVRVRVLEGRIRLDGVAVAR